MFHPVFILLPFRHCRASLRLARTSRRLVLRRYLLTFDKRRFTLLVEILQVTMSQSKTDLLQGTLDLVILKVLALEPMHGWGISQRIQQISKDVRQVNQGSLYPALHRLGSGPNRAPQMRTGKRSITSSTRPAASNCKPKLRAGSGMRPQSPE